MKIINNEYILNKQELIEMLILVALQQKVDDYQEAGHFLMGSNKPLIGKLLDSLCSEETIVHDNIIEELIELSDGQLKIEE